MGDSTVIRIQNAGREITDPAHLGEEVWGREHGNTPGEGAGLDPFGPGGEFDPMGVFVDDPEFDAAWSAAFGDQEGPTPPPLLSLTDDERRAMADRVAIQRRRRALGGSGSRRRTGPGGLGEVPSANLQTNSLLGY